MRSYSKVALLVLGSALAPIACKSSKSPSDRPGASGRLDELFPPAQHGLVIRAGPEPHTLSTLADEFSRATGWTLIIDAETRRELQATTAGTDRDLEIAPENVHAFVETLLAENHFALAIASERPPRLLRLQSMRGARVANLRSAAPMALDAELDAWADEHPAFLVRTLVVLEHLDARALSASYRSQMADGDTQEVLAVGNLNQVIVAGYAPWVRRVRDEFLAFDRAESNRVPTRSGGARTDGSRPPQ